MQEMLQATATACQQNFKTIFSNENVVMDRTFSLDVRYQALLNYLKDRDDAFDLDPYIEAELQLRKKQADELREKERAVVAQGAAEKAAPNADEPKEDADTPLVFGGDFEGEEAGDAIG